MIQEAKAFIKKYGLTRDNLSSRTLKQIFVNLGFKIILFNKFRNTPDVQTLIDAYELKEQMLTRKTFIFVDNESRLLFIRQYIGEDELIHYLLHELGHVWLRHIYSMYDDDLQEREADEFSVLVRVLLRWKMKVHKAAALGVIIAAALYLIRTKKEIPNAATESIS